VTRPKKWEPGDAVLDTADAFHEALASNRVVFVKRYFRDRPVSIRVVANMSYAVVTRLIAMRHIVLARNLQEIPF
jgi:hypothetical protein